MIVSSLISHLFADKSKADFVWTEMRKEGMMRIIQMGFNISKEKVILPTLYKASFYWDCPHLLRLYQVLASLPSILHALSM